MARSAGGFGGRGEGRKRRSWRQQSSASAKSSARARADGGRTLVVSSSVGVVDGVHGNTTRAGPRVALRLELEVGATGLEQGLVDTSSAGDDTDGGAGRAGDGLLGARGQAETRLVLVGRVADDGGVVARGAGHRAAVTDALLNVADNGSLGALREGEDVADVERGLLAGVDERAGGEALRGDEGLLVELVAVGVTEDDLGERRTTGVGQKRERRTRGGVGEGERVRGAEGRGGLSAGGPSSRSDASRQDAPAGVVDDVLDDTADVTVLLGEVEGTQARGGLVQVRVRLEDTSRLTLVLDDTLWDGAKGGRRASEGGSLAATGSRTRQRHSLPWL